MLNRHIQKNGRKSVLPAQKMKAGFSAKGRAFAKGCPALLGDLLKEVFLYSDSQLAVGWRKHTGQQKKGGDA